MHQSVYDFVTRVLGRDEVEGKRVLEVGALDVNGSVRPYVTSLRPAEYIGTDKRYGPRVNTILSAEKLIGRYGCDAFDVVICLETLEHIHHWRGAIYNMLLVLRFGGLFVMTTRSDGFPRHDHPHDHWRFDWHEFATLERFGEIIQLVPDPQHPGLLLCWRKQMGFTFADLDEIHATAAPRWAG